MNLKINNFFIVIFIILAVSGVGTGSLAILALDPDPYHIPVGHVAFGFQRDDGKFVIGSFGPNEKNPLLGSLETQVFDDLKSVKNYFSASGYKSFKAIYVDNTNPTAARNTMTALKGSGFMALESELPTSMSSLILSGSENCLTFAIKVLKAYGANMPEIIPVITSWPRVYYDALSKLGWIESSLSASKLAQTGIGTPLLPAPTSDTPSGVGSSVSGTSGVQFVSHTQDTNSIVGTWKYKDSGDPDDYAWIIVFNADGTYNHPAQHPSQLDPDYTAPAVTGRWTRNGDTYTGYYFNPYTGAAMPPWTVTVHGNSYSGSGFSGNVNGIRLSAPATVSGASIAGVGPLI